EFATFQSYEMHSRAYGDHHILSPADDLPLAQGESPDEILAAVAPRPAIAVPHHVAYVPGYRGIVWERYRAVRSPLVEVFSKHGSGFSDEGPYPYLHTMGPRDGRSTVRRGLEMGHRFGFTGSTDHHAGYPGSHGDGRVAVWAESLTREALWEAFLARRTYAVTGDKIACRFSVNGAPMGSVVAGGGLRRVALDARACAAIDKVIIYRDGRPWQIVNGETLGDASATGPYKVRIEMGWGNAPGAYGWEGIARVRGGAVRSVETCFRGRSVLAPTQDRAEDPDINALDNHLLSSGPQEVAWRCETLKNPSTLHPATAALILEIDGDPAAALHVALNGVEMAATIGELLEGGRATHMQPHNAEAFLLHRAVPEAAYALQREWTDEGGGSYYAEVRQANGQIAWVSPVWVEG
ncbi:MAG: DUF3604 domain-containing protein, partial [Chloroflexi bacterium]|nr:DUF3604 domain-containing protein [Chloroflexota bacterium]